MTLAPPDSTNLTYEAAMWEAPVELVIRPESPSPGWLIIPMTGR